MEVEGSPGRLKALAGLFFFFFLKQVSIQEVLLRLPEVTQKDSAQMEQPQGITIYWENAPPPTCCYTPGLRLKKWSYRPEVWRPFSYLLHGSGKQWVF